MEEKRTTFIDARNQDTSRPKERPPKSNRTKEAIKVTLKILQHFAPERTAKIIWHFFTKPGKPRFTDNQHALLAQAKVIDLTYRNHTIKAYRWGNEGPKVLLSHGWNSKTADFRRMIESLVKAGLVVEGIDMKAHGQSEGEHSALPEFRDILKDYYVKNGPYNSVIGYSLGGIAAGIALSEISRSLHPEHLVIIAAPPYVRYFFEDVVKNDVGCDHRVYEKLCNLVETVYHQPIDYFDLRDKKDQLSGLNMLLIYDEHDKTVPFNRGEEMRKHYPDSHWLHSRGLGHYKIIAYQEVIDQVIKHIYSKELIEN